MREPKKVIVTFLSQSTISSINEDVKNLINQLDIGLPQYKDVQIVLVTNLGMALSGKIKHERIRAIVCGECFSPKSDYDYIVVDNGAVKERNRVLKKMGKKQKMPLEIYEIKGGEIIQIAA